MAAAGVLFLLLLLLALAGTPSTGATGTLSPPSNVRLSVDVKRCQLNASWDPPVPRINCTSRLTYESIVWQDVHTKLYSEKLSRIVIVELGKEIVFGVRAECSMGAPGPWYNATLQQKAVPGTGAVNISCIWHNEEYITCLWKAGENATQDNYHLFHRYQDNLEVRQCTNSTRDGNNFRCTFAYKKEIGQDMLWILVKGASEDVQPMCISGKDILIKMHPPLKVNVSKDSNGVFLEWTVHANRENLKYQIEIKDKATDLVEYEISYQTSKSISLKPNAKHTFRVRVKPEEAGSTWSDWSKEEVWDDRDNNDNTFYTLLYIFIPLCVAILTIIVLVNLKRIKLLILPKIPDPGEVLKKMFEDQSEDLQKHPTYDMIKDEQIHTLTFLERTGNEV